MKKILMVWPKHREDWIIPFKDLSSNFEFIFLSDISYDPNEANYVKDFAKTIYWSDYGSARDVLDKVQPDKLVFMSIETGLSIVLNMVAKAERIPTFILQHGIYTNYKDYRIREKLWKKQETVSSSSQIKASVNFSSFRWIRYSLRGVINIYILLISIYVKASQRIGPYWAAKHLSFEGKRPNEYLCFSPYNAIIHKETDKIDDSRIRYLGSPELVKYLKEEQALEVDKYYLHIDQAFAENSFGEETLTKNEMIEFYLKLNDFCLENNSKLFIKLHPESFMSEWLPQHTNINYLRKVDNFNQYIQSAEGCFGFYSTMVVPAVYWKPTILFSIYYSGLQEALSDISHVRILPFSGFRTKDIKFDKAVRGNKEKLVERFFYHKEQICLQILSDYLNE